MVSFTGGTGDKPWSELSRGLPVSGDVNALCFDAKTAFRLFAATHEGIWSLEGSESEWADFNGDMPRIMTSDIVIDEFSGFLIAGTHGAGVWLHDLSFSRH